MALDDLDGIANVQFDVGSSVPQVPVTDGLMVQYDVAALEGYSEGQNVDPLTDQSGNGWDASLNTGSGAVYREDMLNGLPAIEFTEGSYYDATNSTWSQPNTTFWVNRWTASGTGINNYLLDEHTGDRQLHNLNNGDNIAMWASSFLNGSTDWDQDVAKTGVFNGGSSFLRENGSETASGDAGGNGVGEIRVGADSNGARNYNGFVYELLFYDRELSTTEIEDVESYLADKWGITLTTP